MLVFDAAASASNHDSMGGMAVDDLTAFIGKNAPHYIKRWRLMTQTQRSLGWHWGAALLGFFWLLYRRMYFWFFVYFLLSIVFYFPGGWSGPLWWIVSSLALGFYGHWIYFQHTKHALAGVKLLSNRPERQALAARLGGVDYISPFLFALMLTALIVAFFNVFLLFLAPWIASLATVIAGM